MDDPTCASDECDAPIYALGQCRTCYQRDYRRRWLAQSENRERFNRQRRERYAENPAENLAKQKARRERLKAEGRSRQWTEAQRQSKLLSRYGITKAQFDALLAEQQSRCAICHTDTPVGGWVIDHCHESSIVRGILCRRCNSGIGQLGDDPVRVAAALAYLTPAPPA